MFLWRNKKNYPRIITKISSLIIPLDEFSITLQYLPLFSFRNSNCMVRKFTAPYPSNISKDLCFSPNFSSNLVISLVRCSNIMNFFTVISPRYFLALASSLKSSSLDSSSPSDMSLWCAARCFRST